MFVADDTIAKSTEDPVNLHVRRGISEKLETESEKELEQDTDVDEMEEAVLVPSTFTPVHIMFTFHETLTTGKKVFFGHFNAIRFRDILRPLRRWWW